MQDLHQPVKDSPSALARVGLFLLVPVVGILLLPILLFFIVALYLLAIFHGGRIFVYSFTGKNETPEHDMQKPHFIDVHVHEKTLPDEATPPQKG